MSKIEKDKNSSQQEVPRPTRVDGAPVRRDVQRVFNEEASRGLHAARSAKKPNLTELDDQRARGKDGELIPHEGQFGIWPPTDEK
jgi:hypothetical protein